MKLRYNILFFLSLGILFTSCVIEKRHYRTGFYVNWNNNTAYEQISDTVLLESPARVENENSAVDLVTDVNLIVAEESVDVVPTTGESTETRLESPNRLYERVDDPKPEGHDRLNPVVTPIVGIAFVIPLVLLALELLAAFPANPYVLLIGLPLIATLLFALAMQLRKKYTVLKSIGDKRESLRTSAHFHRYQILLFIYFAAALMLSLGFALSLTSSGILGWIGVIFTGGGIAVGLGVATVLLVLFALYWIRWRKDPTGIKPPRNPNPPKDR